MNPERRELDIVKCEWLDWDLLVLQATILQRQNGKAWHWLNGLFACTRADFEIVDDLVIDFFTIVQLATTSYEVLTVCDEG